MFEVQRKILRARRNSQSKQQKQQKADHNKQVFFKRTWTCEPQLRLEKTGEMKELEKSVFSHVDSQDFDYSYDDGQVNLSTFVQEQFNLIMDDEVSENTAGWRKKVGSNSLIVQKILSHVNFSTLKTARLVCNELQNLANFELGRRNCCRWSFRWDFPLKRNVDLEVLQNSVDLSWMEFDFENLDDMELVYIAKFCGSQIKMLKIYPSDFPRINSFFSAGEFPNVKSLSFHDHFYGGNSGARMRNPWATEFDNLFHLLIEKSNLNPNSALSTAKVEPKLEQLLIGNQDFENNPEFLDQINQILEANKNSLKFLELPLPLCSSSNSTFQPRTGIQIPGILSQVSTIHFHIRCGKREQIESQQFQLPQGFDQKKLPNLKTVRFEFSRVGPGTRVCQNPPLKLRNDSCFKSVINLELGYKCSGYPLVTLLGLLPFYWIPWISSLFPNIENVAVDNWKATDEILRHVFTNWSNLTTLKIRGHFFNRGDSRDLDSVFTGLSENKCAELRSHRNGEPVPISMEILEMKTEPNLNSLKGLKRLEICVLGSSFWCPVSKISSLYAFDLNPELKVAVHHFPEKFKQCKC